MSVRTTKTKVRYVIETALEDDEIDEMIRQSNLIVTRTVGNEGMNSDLLLQLETWLTAHLIAIGKERQPISEKVGDIWVQYQKSELKSFLESTTFGRMVLFLDSSGQFQASSMKRASISAVKQNNTPMGTND